MEEVIKRIKDEIGGSFLVAVSKTKSNEEIMKCYNLGVRDFGENYVQENLGRDPKNKKAGDVLLSHVRETHYPRRWSP